MARRGASVRRAGRERRVPLQGFVITWDVDSRDRAQCARLRRFVFGETSKRDGRTYRYPGFVERPGVRYLGQSVLFVSAGDLSALRGFLESRGIDHVVTRASLGERLRP